MYSRLLSAGLYGLNGEETWVEVDVESGLPVFNIVGLANQSIKEAKDRIHAAVMNSGFDFAARRITVNLTPANKKKEGSHFDLPIALALLMSTGQIRERGSGASLKTAYLGELTLDGRLAPVEGVLPMITGLQKLGVGRVMIPEGNLAEAALVKGMEIIPVATLNQAASHVCAREEIKPVLAEGFKASDNASISVPDFSDIRGQELVKRAAQVAAAGMHGMLMLGPPGVGKSMIGKRIPGIMPPLSYEEQLEVTQIYSVAGELSAGLPMVTSRPFRSPHHSVSAAALIGGGSRPRPGEISLAHCGVLFLDELPEFSGYTLDTLRQPLEDGEVSIVRVNGKCVYPSRFMLIAAMNPCRCGYYGDPVRPCTCTASDRQRYAGKLSGPLLDRIDIHISMGRVDYDDIAAHETHPGTDSARLREGVMRAVEVQRRRYRGLDISCNSQLTPDMIRRFCRLNDVCSSLMREAFSKWRLSARSYHRILRVARTVADIEEIEEIQEEHILEAISYRQRKEQGEGLQKQGGTGRGNKTVKDKKHGRRKTL
ncbi:MAG TPA: YifB family Mg chelatase-like AAA ATPase [Bacillota bacterium]|nr:YifB family Mg chelatase-like AAA ATPase [Bacillota bacterium]